MSKLNTKHEEVVRKSLNPIDNHPTIFYNEKTSFIAKVYCEVLKKKEFDFTMQYFKGNYD